MIKRKILLSFLILSTFIAFGQSKQTGNLCLNFYDEEGLIHDSIKIEAELTSSFGDYIKINGRCFENLDLNPSYSLSVQKNGYYQFQKMLYIKQPQTVDSIFLHKVQTIYTFEIQSDTNYLNPKHLKSLSDFFEKYGSKIKKLELGINTSEFKNKDFETSIDDIYHLYMKKTLHNRTSCIDFQVIFEHDNTNPIIYHIRGISTCEEK